jgi:hypothetical protein
MSEYDALSYRDQVIADRPLAYWRFGEALGPTATDEMGRYPGTYGDVELDVPGAIAGDSDGAAEFSTIDSAVVIGDELDQLVNAEFSFEVWAKPAVVTDEKDHRLITKRITVTASDDNGFSLLLTAEDKIALETFNAGQWAGGKPELTLPVDVFSHVVVTYDGVANLHFYLNGQSVEDIFTPNAINVIDNGANLVIGSNSTADGSFWIGCLDEVAIYDHQLAPDRVRRHFEAATAD